MLDTSVLLAAYDSADAHHAQARGFFELNDDELLFTPLVVCEMDHLLRRAPAASAAFREDLDAGAFTVRWWSTAMSETLAVARELAPMSLADASLVALAPVARTDRIATLDPSFRRARTRDGDPFTLLAVDAAPTPPPHQES